MLLSKQFEVETQLFFNLTFDHFAIKPMVPALHYSFHHAPTRLRLSSLQYSRNRLRDTIPVSGLGLELFSPRFGQFVEFSPAIVFRNVPLRSNPTALFHAIERGVE